MSWLRTSACCCPPDQTALGCYLYHAFCFGTGDYDQWPQNCTVSVVSTYSYVQEVLFCGTWTVQFSTQGFLTYDATLTLTAAPLTCYGERGYIGTANLYRELISTNPIFIDDGVSCYTQPCEVSTDRIYSTQNASACCSPCYLPNENGLCIVPTNGWGVGSTPVFGQSEQQVTRTFYGDCGSGSTTTTTPYNGNFGVRVKATCFGGSEVCDFPCGGTFETGDFIGWNLYPSYSETVDMDAFTRYSLNISTTVSISYA